MLNENNLLKAINKRNMCFDRAIIEEKTDCFETQIHI